MKEKKEIKVTQKQLLDTYRGDQIRFEQLQRRIGELGQVLNEMLLASESIREMQKAKVDESMMVSLGAGIYAEAKLADTKSVKSSLAGNVLVSESAEKALSKLEDEIKRARKDMDALNLEMGKTVQNLQGISEILRRGREMQAMQSWKGPEPSSVS